MRQRLRQYMLDRCLSMAVALASFLGIGVRGADAIWVAALEAARAGGESILPAEDAAGAVDGVTDGGFAFHTSQDESPWWQVDLGATYQLERVVVFAPHIPERLNGFTVQLSDEGFNWRLAHTETKKTDGRTTLTVPLNGKDGRYVRILVPATIWMHLAEVQVFGMADPEKNLALKRPALQSSVSQWSTRSVRLETPSEEWQTDMALGLRVIGDLTRGAGPDALRMTRAAAALAADKVRLDDAAWSTLYAEARASADTWRDVITQWKLVDLDALARAIDDLTTTFPETYPDGAGKRARCAGFAAEIEAIRTSIATNEAGGWERAAEVVAFQREVLLANPVLDFERLLLIRRQAGNLGLPANWESNCNLGRTGYDNDLAVMSPFTSTGDITTVFRPDDDTFVGDVDLHFGAARVLFSKSSTTASWQVYEMAIDPVSGAARSEPRQVTPNMGDDVNNYDACYLPSDEIIYSSTAPMVAVPCVNGGAAVANLFRMQADGSGSRQLCFDQEHGWCPTMLNNGRVLYSRWEYADLPHSNSRLLFHMNPDGTSQMEYYGSNSYWPNSTFYARPIPGHPTQVVGVISGHHGVRRMGELIIFDPALGRREADGVVQRIPGYGKPVEPVVADQLVDASWPKFLHPFPLGRDDGKGDGKVFLVAMQPTAGALWGIYLVDVFDNMLLLKQSPGYALLEPLPLKQTKRPPVVPDKVDLTRKDGIVYLADVYRGPGLKGVPKGEVKALRVTSYTYGYRGLGGLYGTIGMDGPWDIRRILGTVPVQPDGSAVFRIPANVPVAVQPLDADGKALQIMRSWFTAMPGEVISCVGCHEIQNETPPAKLTIASRQPPVEIKPWYGESRGFAFLNEVQPVLDKHCAHCHNGVTTAAGKPVFSLQADPMPRQWVSKMSGHAGGWGGKFTLGYVNLHRYVRHPGIESDMHMASPMDFHADNTELVQTLKKGHHGVALAPEDWDRLVTWIDMNTPYHGDWATIAGDTACQLEDRRAELRKQYANVEERHIDKPGSERPVVSPLADVPSAPVAAMPMLSGWPETAAQAGARQTRAAETLGLGNGIEMAFVYVPPGSLVMGSATGPGDESPPSVVRVPEGFWMSTTEVTNAQFGLYDPTHDSRREHKQGYQFGVKGYPLNAPRQPVARVSWDEANRFCQWLRETTQLEAALPTEAQWEYACRAGTASALSFGAADADFSPFANVADAKTSEFAGDPYTLNTPIIDPPEFDDWLPKNARFNDGGLVAVDVGRYLPNVWGLQDMHGNAAEWTRSLYRAYPYVDDDGRNDLTAAGERVVRGGSWRDRVEHCTSSYRIAYRPYQCVYNVGFRVIIDADRRTLGGDASQASTPPAAAGGMPF